MITLIYILAALGIAVVAGFAAITTSIQNQYDEDETWGQEGGIKL